MTRPAFLAALRARADLTQAQVADRLGVTPQAVSVWETSATIEPRSSSTYVALLRIYGATPAETEALGRHLVTGEELPDVVPAGSAASAEAS